MTRGEDQAVRIKNDLYAEAPAEILALVSDDLVLMGQLQGFCDDVREGLEAVEAGTGTVSALEIRLASRKTGLLAAASKAALARGVDSHHYTLERLISNHAGRALACARELAGG
jgi:hypothetical protein